MSEQQSGALEQAVEHTTSSVKAAMEQELEVGEFCSCAWAMPGRLLAAVDGKKEGELVRQCECDVSKGHTAVLKRCPLMSLPRWLTSPARAVAMSRGGEPLGHGPQAAAKPSLA